MQYSLFTHGTALEIETPDALASSIKVGWGTQILFREPVAENVEGLPVFPEVGPGSWFHIPLPSTFTTFGRRNPRLESVTLLFESHHCRILHVHVYDGVDIVQEFNDIKLPKLAGDFLHKRDSKDINPEAASLNPQTFHNTLRLQKPRRVFSAIGISFYACAFIEDFDEDGFAHDSRFHGPFPEAILTISAAGGQFIVEDNFLTSTVAALRSFLGWSREP